MARASFLRYTGKGSTVPEQAKNLLQSILRLLAQQEQQVQVCGRSLACKGTRIGALHNRSRKMMQFSPQGQDQHNISTNIDFCTLQALTLKT